MKTEALEPLPDDMVFGFTAPHRTGTICGADCEQCGGKEMELTGIGGQSLPMQPLYIVAQATVEDWRRDVLKHGAINPRAATGAALLLCEDRLTR